MLNTDTCYADYSDSRQQKSFKIKCLQSTNNRSYYFILVSTTIKRVLEVIITAKELTSSIAKPILMEGYVKAPIYDQFHCQYMQHCTKKLLCMTDIDANILCKTININYIASIKLIVYGPLYLVLKEVRIEIKMTQTLITLNAS